MRLILFAATLCCVAFCSCRSRTDCSSCVLTSSWPGAPCRWCPLDHRCHAVGSLYNLCSEFENIISTEECHFSSKVGKYNESLARMAFIASAAAYDSLDPNRCVSQVSDCRVVSSHVATEPLTSYALHSTMSVCPSERMIILAFRGTESTAQLFAEGLSLLLEPKLKFPGGGNVQEYFYSGFHSLWREMEGDFAQLLAETSSEYRVLFTGHSLGAALASLGSSHYALFPGRWGLRGIYLYTFGQPRVGDYDYARAHDDLVPDSWRVVRHMDIVPHLPTCTKKSGRCVNEPGAPGPYHHGTEVYYTDHMDFFKECHGKPRNEDTRCGNGAVTWIGNLPKAAKYFTDHTHYFGVEVHTFGMSGCAN